VTAVVGQVVGAVAASTSEDAADADDGAGRAVAVSFDGLPTDAAGAFPHPATGAASSMSATSTSAAKPRNDRTVITSVRSRTVTPCLRGTGIQAKGLEAFL
jgi:hypothetical protein